MSAPTTLPIGPDRAIWVWAALPPVCSTPRISIVLAGSVSRRVLLAAMRIACALVQRDDAATTFDAEYLSQREAAAEDLMLACRMTRGIGPDLLVRAASVIADRRVGGGLRPCGRVGPCHLGARARSEVHAGPVTSADVVAGRVRARLAPTHLGWLDGNVLFELFWDLA